MQTSFVVTLAIIYFRLRSEEFVFNNGLSVENLISVNYKDICPVFHYLHRWLPILSFHRHRITLRKLLVYLLDHHLPDLRCTRNHTLPRRGRYTLGSWQLRYRNLYGSCNSTSHMLSFFQRGLSHLPTKFGSFVRSLYDTPT